MRLRRLFWPTLITLLGAFVRWHRLGDMRTLWDHAYPIAQAQQLLSNGKWPANLARDWPNQAARLTRFVQAAEGPLELRSGALYLAVIYVTSLKVSTIAWAISTFSPFTFLFLPTLIRANTSLNWGCTTACIRRAPPSSRRMTHRDRSTPHGWW